MARDPEAQREAKRRWKERNPEAVREQQRRKDATPDAKERHRVKTAVYMAALREDLLDAYGRECACCGAAEPAFLTFDHPASDGGEKRRVYGGAQAEWRAVRRMGFPQGYYVVLCFNCNQGRHRNGGVCPHEQRRTLQVVA